MPEVHKSFTSGILFRYACLQCYRLYELFLFHFYRIADASVRHLYVY